MNTPPLRPAELELVRSVLRLHPEVTSATLFGSRAKGTHSDRSDVDLAVAGEIEPLRAEAIAAELEELPLPYRFDVQSLAHIQHRPLLEHIQRVGDSHLSGAMRVIAAMLGFVSEWDGQFAQAAQLEQATKANPREVGYGG
jgi:uncharacterized protein